MRHHGVALLALPLLFGAPARAEDRPFCQEEGAREVTDAGAPLAADGGLDGGVSALAGDLADLADAGEVDGSAEASGCISFEEASELAWVEGSGIYEVMGRVDPPLYGILHAYALNDDAICRDGACYLKPGGLVRLTTGARTQTRFVAWSGCSGSTAPMIELSGLTNVECIAHYVPGIPPRR